MTRQMESTELDSIVELLAEHGFEGMAQAVEILFNEAMKLQRSEALRAEPYQRTDERRGHANGFKPKTVASRLGKLALQVPQTRGVGFYPTVLERGERSERALKLAVAEMKTGKPTAPTSTWKPTDPPRLHPANLQKRCCLIHSLDIVRLW